MNNNDFLWAIFKGINFRIDDLKSSLKSLTEDIEKPDCDLENTNFTMGYLCNKITEIISILDLINIYFIENKENHLIFLNTYSNFKNEINKLFDEIHSSKFDIIWKEREN